jgi:hypothetical protein
MVEAGGRNHRQTVSETILKVVALKRVEWITATLLSAVVLFLLFVRATHAGALWRDESDSAQLAQMGWREMWERSRFASFPILFSVLVRTHITLFGAGDNALRLFGLIIGLAFVGIAWWYSRTLFAEAPLLLLALIGLNTTFLTAGTWLRGYGPGSVFMLVAFVLTARLLREPTPTRLAAVFLAYLASMQCLFFNAVLAPAMALAAGIVFAFRGRFKLALSLTGAITVCEIAYIPRVKMLPPVKDWAFSADRSPISLQLLWKQFAAACGEPSGIMPYVWHIVFLVAVFGAIWRLTITWRQSGFESNLLLFVSLTSLISIVGYGAFLAVVHKFPWPRYYLPLICLIAVSVDLIIANLSCFRWIRMARLILVIGLLIFLPRAAWPPIILRETNVDLVAAMLGAKARPNDLIVVKPWYLGISFNRYYHGAAPWMTVPEISDHQTHRYDLFKEKIMAQGPIADVIGAMEQTLKSGNRVWLTDPEILPPGQEPLLLPPATSSQSSWDGYERSWSQQIGAFIQQHAEDGQFFDPQPGVNKNERVSLCVLQGWRD